MNIGEAMGMMRRPLPMRFEPACSSAAMPQQKMVPVRNMACCSGVKDEALATTTAGAR